VIALVIVTALYARRRVTHPFTNAQVDAARAVALAEQNVALRGGR
jgi:hypothetical protein